MKKLITLLMATVASFHLFGQFDWEHTGGPEGGAAFQMTNNDEYAFYSDPYFLYRTTDGINWEKIDQPNMWPIATKDNILVGQQSVYPYDLIAPNTWKISFDNGLSWNEINKPNGVKRTSVFSVSSHGIYVPVGSTNTLYRSQDDGMTWEVISTPFQVSYESIVFDDRLYMDINKIIWRSSTNGGSWSSITPPLFPTENIKNFYVHNEHILIATSNRLLHSHDDGFTWDSHSAEFPDLYNKFVSIGNVVYLQGGPTGLARTLDYGITLEHLPTGQYENTLWTIAKSGDKVLLGTDNKGVLLWDDNAFKLIESNATLGSAAIYGLAFDGEKLWAATGTKVFDFHPSQGVWGTNSLLPTATYNYSHISTNNNGLVAAVSALEDTLYVSKDSGNSWNAISLDVTGPINNTVRDLQIIDSSIFIVNDFNGTFCSNDFGANWQKPYLINDVLFHYRGFVKFGGKLFAHNSKQIIISNDGGKNWEVYADFSLGHLSYLYSAGDFLMAGVVIDINGNSHSRIFKSENGINWQYAHDGLPEGDLVYPSFYKQELNPFSEFAGTYYAYHTDFGYYASKDTCKTWLPIEKFPQQKTILGDSIFYAGGSGGGIVSSPVPKVYGEIINGTTYFDKNNNGVYEPNELPLSSVKLLLNSATYWRSNYFTTSNIDGKYYLGILPNSNDTLRPFIPSKYVENITPPYYTADSGGDGKDFGIYLTPDITDASIYGHYSGRPRPGFNFYMSLNYKNEGTTDADATVSLQLDPKLEFIESNPAPTQVIGDSLVWDIGNMPLFNKGNIWLKTKVSDSAMLGEWVKSTCHITPSNADDAPSDNSWTMCDTFVSSFDPNDKRVEPAEGLTADEIAEGKELFYTIRFQNTGTYLAEKVRITDQLDTALFWPSFRLIAASHEITSLELHPGGLLEITFSNINLPDSMSNEPTSHGFVTFAIQRNRAFNPTRPVSNTAAIYFDFNEPIFTNEVQIGINEGPPLSALEWSGQKIDFLTIFPNPSNGQFTVSTNGKMSGKGDLILLNVDGKTIKQLTVNDLSKSIILQMDNQLDGVYFIKLTNGEKVMSGKVVLQRK